jgi:hypothetical protein
MSIRRWIDTLCRSLIGRSVGGRKRLRNHCRLDLEVLEERVVPTTGWTALANQDPDTNGALTMVLLSNGNGDGRGVR